MRMASMYYGGLFDPAYMHLPDKVTRKEDVPVGTAFYEKLSEFMGPSDIICSELILNSQKYQNGDLLVVNVRDRDEVTVGIVQTILVRFEDVFFVIRKYKAVRNRLNFFDSESVESNFTFIKATDLADYKPLVRYGTDLKLKFYFHHYVSFSFE